MSAIVFAVAARIPFRELLSGTFGMIPQWGDMKLARSTYNARSETVHQKNSFRDAWKYGKHCVIPAARIYEPLYRSDTKPVFTPIERADGRPMGIAGLWTNKRMPDGSLLHSFTMLTINADNHPFMRNFHDPRKEKRMIVILQEEDYDDWLAGHRREELIRQFPAENMRVAEKGDVE
jgi:putative SOS response-associated peptidase YedK